MKHSIARAALAAALLLGGTSAAVAQVSPLAVDGGARALDRAYRAIGEAEALNGRSAYVAQARGHYTAAYARYRRGDADGTAGEAFAAAALARAALAERMPPVPRGLEAPPPPQQPGAGVSELSDMPGFRGFDPAGLQQLVALENTAEVRSLAERATSAAAGAQKALAANDREAARRGELLARDLALAVRGLAAADHPDQVRLGPTSMPRRPL